MALFESVVGVTIVFMNSLPKVRVTLKNALLTCAVVFFRFPFSKLLPSVSISHLHPFWEQETFVMDNSNIMRHADNSPPSIQPCMTHIALLLGGPL